MGALVDIITRSSKLEPNTRSAYTLCVQRFEAHSPDPRGWNAAAVEHWRDQLLSKMSAQTANKHLYALRYASKRREALGLGPDFARVAEGAKVHRTTKRRALTHDEMARIVATTSEGSPYDVRDCALIILAVRTGLRVSGLCGLTWGDIQGPRATVKLKGGHKHVVVLDPECLAALEAWRAWLGARKASGPVFVSMRPNLNDDDTKKRPTFGDALTRTSVHRILADRGRAAGLRRPIHPHLFRHTFITWALEAGVPAQRIMVMTGHRSLGTLSGYVSDLESENDPVGGYLPPLLTPTNGRKR